MSKKLVFGIAGAALLFYVLRSTTADTAFSLYGSIFRVLVFDPLAFESFLGGGV